MGDKGYYVHRRPSQARRQSKGHVRRESGSFWAVRTEATSYIFVELIPTTNKARRQTQTPLTPAPSTCCIIRRINVASHNRDRSTVSYWRQPRPSLANNHAFRIGMMGA